MLSEELVAFIEGGQSIHVATRDADLRPDGARAVAAFVEPDRVHMTVFVPEAALHRVLPNLEANGDAAVVFGRPTDDNACQVKGRFVGQRPATEADRPAMLAQWDRFREKLIQIGVPDALVGSWTTWPCRAVRLQIHAAFNQTPGPNAGARL
jgi:hypothetical protein